MSKTTCEKLAAWINEIGHSPASKESVFRMHVVEAVHTIVDPTDECMNPPPEETALIEQLRQNVRKHYDMWKS